ncbi:hypothetical protein AKO1_007904 [Acrasis kona]|uniref:RCC1-like domain-containing protein n=1 Tax=Acrasis kona TaxID=1008807 RepID=A0AAW2YNH0_9EUKA
MDVITFGANEKGQLGSGDQQQRNDLSFTIPQHKFKSISSGGFHNIALKEDGSVYAWGYGNNGQLGGGNTEDRSTPTLVEGVKGVQIAAGQLHSLVLTDEGKLMGFGDNAYGQLAQGVDDDFMRDVPTVINIEKSVKNIHVGGYYNIVETVDGEYYGWGANNGALGIGNSDQKRVPTKIEELSNKNVKKITTGSGHCLYLTQDGKVHGTGYNRQGQLGLGDKDKSMVKNNFSPTFEFLSVKDIIAAGNSTLCVTEGGELFVCGQNAQGELSLDDRTNRNVPTRLELPEPVEKVWGNSGSSHFFVKLNSGKIFACGRNEKGQRGVSNNEKSLVPEEVVGLEGKNVSEIVCGSHHTMVVVV